MKFASRTRIFGIHGTALLLFATAPAFAPVLFTSLAQGSEVSLSQTFDAAQEFPNYFLPAQYRNLRRSEIPQEVLNNQEELVNRALGSIYERLMVPIIPEGESQVRPVRYFPYLREKLLKIDPGMKLYASGGVVRTAISYLYDRIVQELQKNPEKDSSRILEEIASAKEDIPAIDVRGVGSDFDLLIKASGNRGPELEYRATEITSSAMGASGDRLGNLSLSNTLYTVPDVRGYDSQIERSTRQGGSVVDYLAYDVTDHRLKDPPRFPGLAQRIVSGNFEYAPPSPGAAPEDLGDSVIRGARTLLELPWLKLENPDYYRSQIRKIEEERSSGKPLSKRALGQFSKGIRNSRYFGAHNRFYRAAKGSVESEIMKLAQGLNAEAGGNLIPEFADLRRIDLRKGDHAELHGLPETLLVPVSEFRARYTYEGALYHGTPSLETSLAILRQGLFLSKDGQGTAVYGRGVYASPDRNLAQEYGQGGLVFTLELKNDPRINILDWQKVAHHPAIESIQAEAKRQGRDVFEYLSREHGIDIIYNTHVLIQNADVVKLNGGIKSIFQAIATNITRVNHPDPMTIEEFSRLADHLEKMGESPLETVQAVLDSLTRNLTDGGPPNLDLVRGVIALNKRVERLGGKPSHSPREILEGVAEGMHKAGRIHLPPAKVLDIAELTLESAAHDSNGKFILTDHQKWLLDTAMKLVLPANRQIRFGALDRIDANADPEQMGVEFAIRAFESDPPYVKPSDEMLLRLIRILASPSGSTDPDQPQKWSPRKRESDIRLRWKAAANRLLSRVNAPHLYQGALEPILEAPILYTGGDASQAAAELNLKTEAIKIAYLLAPPTKGVDRAVGEALFSGYPGLSEQTLLEIASQRPPEAQNVIYESALSNVMRGPRSHLVSFVNKILLTGKYLASDDELLWIFKFLKSEDAKAAEQLIPLVKDDQTRMQMDNDLESMVRAARANQGFCSKIFRKFAGALRFGQ